MGVLTADRYYRAVVQNGTCAPANTTAVKITVSTCPEPCELQIGGTVYRDTDGSSNGVNGTPVNGVSIGLYVALVKSGLVQKTVQVQSNGTYQFNLTEAGTFSLVLSNNASGSATPAIPGGIMPVAEGGPIDGTSNNSLGDGSADGMTEVILTCPQSASYQHIDFGLSGGALPVTLISLKVQASSEGNKLTWRTSNEVNFDRFEIEYSSAPQSGFERIGVQKGGGSDYLYVDNTVRNGLSYYRLKMIDLDGTYTYSRIVSLASQVSPAPHLLYPNPSDGTFTLSCGDDIESFRINDLSGSSIPAQMTGAKGKYEFRFPKGWSAGLYVITYKIRGKFFSQHFIVAY